VGKISNSCVRVVNTGVVAQRTALSATEPNCRATEAAVTTINQFVQANARCFPCPCGREHAANPLPPFFFAVAGSTGQKCTFWGDERYVPIGDLRSNYRIARESLLDAVPCPIGNVHPMPTDLADSDVAVRSTRTAADLFLPKPVEIRALGSGSEPPPGPSHASPLLCQYSQAANTSS
jgi:hypothetical protein